MAENLHQLLAIPMGYILGSIPFAFIVGKFFGKLDLRIEGDGKVSAAAVYRRIGFWAFLMVVILDVGKGIGSILITRIITDNWLIIFLTGIATVAGHNWPIFLKFKGGLGATAIYGVLAGVGIYQLLIAFIPGLICVITTKKSGLSTAIIIIFLTIVYMIQVILYYQGMIEWFVPLYIIFLPIALSLLMILKRWQIRKSNYTG